MQPGSPRPRNWSLGFEPHYWRILLRKHNHWCSFECTREWNMKKHHKGWWKELYWTLWLLWEGSFECRSSNGPGNVGDGGISSKKGARIACNRRGLGRARLRNQEKLLTLIKKLWTTKKIVKKYIKFGNVKKLKITKFETKKKNTKKKNCLPPKKILWTT